MAPTVADYLLERLRAWDVQHVFAYAGDGINGILAAWGRADNEPQFIQARHEEMAAFEAVGYAKFTGRVGVCMATSGPGAIHLLNGLYDAKLDHVPIVAIVGQTNRSAMGGSYQQEVDLISLYKDVASDYVQMVTVPEQLPNVLDRAIRRRETGRGCRPRTGGCRPAPPRLPVRQCTSVPRNSTAWCRRAASHGRSWSRSGQGQVAERPRLPSGSRLPGGLAPSSAKMATASVCPSASRARERSSSARSASAAQRSRVQPLPGSGRSSRPDRTAYAKAAAVAAPGHEPWCSLSPSDSPAGSVRPELITFTP